MLPIVFDNISSLMQRLDLPKPLHPLVALVHYDQTKPDISDAGSPYLLHFYKIAFKSKFSGRAKYGPGTYDFQEGGIAFVAPNQLVELSADLDEHEGYALYFHPDLLFRYPLGKSIHQYGFFSYSVSEALFLSEKEKQIISALFESVRIELEHNIDRFSQDVLVSQIELLLNHCNRFYNRQFLTRHVLHHNLIDQMNLYLNVRSANQQALTSGLPTTREIATHLKVSQRYLSDMLKSLTGKTTQEHIHLHLVEKAKELLGSQPLTTAEVAYQLGFEHPQSFNKLFKQKTGLSPASFRQGL
ncbi:AraC-like ligand binding domain-containing protein [Dyadobacter koreensis]|uniref:AraC-like ligand binding domain-containing protein n=1 Tax=Dyadobacter koreensis TaxID=408657 RepID=A0A1H6QHF5_9BACT|nr:helix-turn-helix domain-containing protein [Dyadobacter koreensis]SEI41326.1 AraC-like ligand binding domain-containing protein [Dyadobacter koreensis]